MLDAHTRVAPLSGLLQRVPSVAPSRIIGATLPTRVARIVWAVLVVAGLAFSLFGRSLLPARFSYDAAHIAAIAKEGIAAGKGDQSFIAVGEVYNVLGLAGNPLAVAIASFAVLALIHTVVFRRLASRGRLPVVGLVLLAASLSIGSVYLTTYAKDSIVLVVTAVCLLAPQRPHGEVYVFVTISIYATCFRSYWLLVLAVYVALRLADRFSRRRWLTILLPVVVILLAAIAYSAATGFAIDNARVLSNSIRLDSPDARTMINEWVSLPQPWGSVVNIPLTLVLLVVPIPLLALGSAYYIAIALLLACMWGAVITAYLRRPATGAGVLATRSLILLLAFLSTQAIFEPDYGSALRHLSPLLPLVAAGVGLVISRSREDRADPPSGRAALRGRHAA